VLTSKGGTVRAYVFVTGIVFGLILAAHGARVVVEGFHTLQDPWFIVTSLAALALLVWASRLLWRRTPAPA
jgi:hypothetical protein